MSKQKLETILKEEWLNSGTWHSIDKSNQKKFHLALQRAYKELEKTPSHDDFFCVVNSVVNDPNKSKDVVDFAKKADIMFKYYKIIK